jgi:hypothetical protein
MHALTAVIPGRASSREPGIQRLALDSGFAAIGPRFARTHWRRPGMTTYCLGAGAGAVTGVALFFAAGALGAAAGGFIAAACAGRYFVITA